MAYFAGRMRREGQEPMNVTVEIDDAGRFRMQAGRRHMGSWPLDEVKVERTSVYRFAVEVAGDHFELFPEEPLDFSDAAGAVIDLTETRGRFGLKARIRDAAGS